MKKKSKIYILYGFIGIVILFAAYWGFTFLKGMSIFNTTNAYYVYYERIEGLNESSPVTINGYKVGQVGEIVFVPERNYALRIRIDIAKDFEIPDSTVARIYSMDLMGTKGVELVFGNKVTFHKPDDFLIGDMEQSLKDQVSVQMLPIKKQAEDLMMELTKAITIITYIFNDETRANLAESFESIKVTLTYLEGSAYSLDTLLKKESNKISRILTNVEYLTKTLSNNSENLSNIFDNLSTFSDTLVALNISKTIIEANKAIESFNSIMVKVNNGEGSIGKLVKDDKLAVQLEDAATNLKKLLFDIQYNPKKYVNFSLMNIGRTVNVADETELTNRDKKVVTKQREKNEKEAQKNHEKEQNRIEKEKKDENADGAYLDGPVKFMIQIRSAATPIDKNSPELKGYSEVVEIKSAKYYKYFVYPHEDVSQTSYYLKLAQEDFADAFPMAFVGSSPVSYSKGVSILANK